ncbi:hypothetical protein HMPREF9238_00351 [Gleimia europaea ACS-120-V-Col10b]|uniref:Uncharacterized protein n=1 Tax=Gleimia europaea ACS-120-V-Col10b TaxID=883069 RepID=A0A9W5VW84_9ACTO|nr:hypothetical protein HMPREF9238_00351 [Gleimia europaea ACS-120-V-Col10b]
MPSANEVNIPVAWIRAIAGASSGVLGRTDLSAFNALLCWKLSKFRTQTTGQANVRGQLLRPAYPRSYAQLVTRPA